MRIFFYLTTGGLAIDNRLNIVPRACCPTHNLQIHRAGQGYHSPDIVLEQDAQKGLFDITKYFTSDLLSEVISQAVVCPLVCPAVTTYF